MYSDNKNVPFSKVYAVSELGPEKSHVFDN